MSFKPILEALVAANAPAVRAAIFCDHEGEKVASCNGNQVAFDVDVVGASMALAAMHMKSGSRLRLVAGDLVVWMLVVDLGCYLVVWCQAGLDLGCREQFPSVAKALLAEL
ncbi:MAG: hypothetical protein Q8O67_26225 [Deltaproteobacteria bacterium]|nr:hypothetical protein [Deltaproteobacteria bacterium]